MKPIISLIALIGSLHLIAFSSPQKGILIFPVVVNKQDVGEPGQVVTFSYLDAKKLLISLELNGTKYGNLPDYHVIPYDSMFSPSRVFLYLTNTKGRIWTEDVMVEARYRYSMTKHACSEFPTHPLFENLFALQSQYVAEYERISTDGKEIPTMSKTIAKEYLERFPNGKFRDEVEWRLIQLENHVYEYEGSASGPLAHLNVYEDYLNKHPGSQMADHIQLKIAYLCRVITESLNSDTEKDTSRGLLKVDIQKFRLKALTTYNELLQSNDLKVRETARVAIYNIEHGRTVYVGGTDW